MTSTLALTNATLPYAIKLAEKKKKKACKEDNAVLQGVNIVDGKIVVPAVGEAFGMECSKLEL